MYMQILLALFNSPNQHCEWELLSFAHTLTWPSAVPILLLYPTDLQQITVSLVTMFRFESMCAGKYGKWKSHAGLLNSGKGFEGYFLDADSENWGVYYHTPVYWLSATLSAFLCLPYDAVSVRIYRVTGRLKGELWDGKNLEGPRQYLIEIRSGHVLKGLRNLTKYTFENFQCPSEIQIGTLPNGRSWPFGYRDLLGRRTRLFWLQSLYDFERHVKTIVSVYGLDMYKGPVVTHISKFAEDV
jgi:hypothetical protein